jgi:hypothetical protein
MNDTFAPIRQDERAFPLDSLQMSESPPFVVGVYRAYARYGLVVRIDAYAVRGEKKVEDESPILQEKSHRQAMQAPSTADRRDGGRARQAPGPERELCGSKLAPTLFTRKGNDEECFRRLLIRPRGSGLRELMIRATI